MALNSPIMKLYDCKVKYSDRPVLSNIPYNYELVKIESPSDIFLKIKDRETADHEARLQKLLKGYVPEKQFSFPPLYKGMPVIVMLALDSGATVPARGELSYIAEKTVTVFLVDGGTSLQVSVDHLFPVTVDLLRVPKIGMLCELLHTRSPLGHEWPKKASEPKFFLGETQTVIFNDYFPDTQMYEVNLEVDGINTSLKLFQKGLANPSRLEYLDDSGSPYPVFNYDKWVGLKVLVFAVRAYKDEKDQKIKVVLQMDNELVERILTEITAYVEKVASGQKAAELKISPGSPCLAKYGGGEYFRATILKQVDDQKVQIEYTDYKDVAVVSKAELMGIPESLLQKPEAAVVCQLTELLNHDLADKQWQKLQDLTSDKDLYAVVDAFDPYLFGKELLVSLHQPTDYESGADKPICSELLGIKDKPMLQVEYLQPFVPASQAIGDVFLKKGFPDATRLIPGASPFISCIVSWDSVWFQHEGDDEVAERISNDLKFFYGHQGCDDKSRKHFIMNIAVGDYVAATIEEENGSKTWYRGRVRELEIGGKGAFVHFMDYGDGEWVALKEVFPLHSYYYRESAKAFEVAVLK